MHYDLRGVMAGVGIVLALGLVSRSAEAADIGVMDAAVVAIRAYTPSRLGSDIRTARRTVSRILGGASIQIDWRECGLAADDRDPAAPCGQPLQSNELVLRIVSAGRAVHGRGLDALGDAFIDLDAGGGSLATVYDDRVRAMARGAGIGFAELLGRTIAHEIGHLLMGNSGHTPQGLMRASWSSADLRRNRATEWLFEGREGEVMRKGIARRFRFFAAVATTTPREAGTGG
jgi:hypothetical protein